MMQKRFGILKAYVVPHPPLILPEIGRGQEEEIRATIRSMETMAREIADLAPDTIILTSPHAPLYRDAFFVSFTSHDEGHMGQFGRPDVRVRVQNDLDLGKAILRMADQEDIPMYADTRTNPLDHGSLVPLRFILKAYEDFKFLRLGLSGFPGKTHYLLGQILPRAAVQEGRRVVLVASGDLSHVLKKDGPYGFKPEGPRFDQALTDILSRAAFDELLDMPRSLTQPAAQCGLGSFQIMAGALDGKAVRAQILSYEGPFGVGYAVGTFEPGQDRPDRRFLEGDQDLVRAGGEDFSSDDPYIQLARQTIEAYVTTGVCPDLPEDLPQEMLKNRAATFVTLHRNGALRGCIGTLEPYRESIAHEIQANAISAATKDPRFMPLRPEELQDLEVSVDVLKPAEAIQGLDQLDPKRYGVIVRSGHKRGVLLPNLEGVDRAQYQVDIARQKAGIGKYEAYELERFEVIRHE